MATVPDVEFVRGSDWGGGVGGILYSVRAGGGSGGVGGTRYDHYDGRGDVGTQTDGAGTVTYQAQYEAWGTRTAEFGSNADRQRANTKEEDPTGLLHEGRRCRDLETGLFLSPDPLGMVDGPNVYAYVRQNPWSKFDPEGLAVTHEDDPAQSSVKEHSTGSGILQEHGTLGLGSFGNTSLLLPGHADGSVAAPYLPQDHVTPAEDWSPIKRADGKPGWAMSSIPLFGNMAWAAYHSGNYGEEGAMWGSIAMAGVDAVTLGRGGMIGKTAKAVVEEGGEQLAANSGRGLSKHGGIFSSTVNEAGGEVWTSVGKISQNDIAPLVNGGLYKGDVDIISGVHGLPTGATRIDADLFTNDVARFGDIPGVSVHNFPDLSPSKITGLLRSPNTTIGGFCDSDGVLSPFK